MDKILQIAQEIHFRNPAAVFSGSFALVHQGFNVRRPVKDLDVYIPFGVQFETTEGMEINKMCESDKELYEDDLFERLAFFIFGISVDVFRPTEEQYNLHTEFTEKGLPVFPPEEILKFKIRHYIEGQHYSRWKHKDDIIHFLTVNGC